jgi:RHH-type proline utilization regulon transcriptional repressor/proline dehydrogenase/delta 1-pyrroline-5-carboxylate dehydrogenase
MSGATKSISPEGVRDLTGDRPFAAFLADIQPHDGLRAAIDARYRIPETECLPALLSAAQLPAALKAKARDLARHLVEGLRARPATGLVQGLMHE